MPDFHKDGKTIELKGLYNRVSVGQVVVLDYVNFGNENPLSKYPQPSIFTVSSITPEAIILIDSKGKHVECYFLDIENRKHAYNSCLFDQSEYLAFIRARDDEKIRRKNNRINHLEAQVSLLKSILIAQGTRIITNEQAKALEIPTN